MSSPPENKIEINLGRSYWSRSKPIPSIHRHVGYILNQDTREIKISPEFTINDQNQVTRIQHDYVINRNWSPRPKFHDLIRCEEETEIMEISYLDPTLKSGTCTTEEISEFEASTFWFLGYIVEETSLSYKLAMSVFDYTDGSKEYEEPHIIPKGSIQSITNFTHSS